MELQARASGCELGWEMDLIKGSEVQGSEVQGWEVQNSAQSLAAEAANLIEKET